MPSRRIMNPQHRFLLDQFRNTKPGRGQTTQRPEHLGTQRRWYGLKNEQRRRIMLDFIAANRDLPYEDWLALIDSLYQGVSYEERCAPQTLLVKFPRYRRQLPLTQLEAWLGALEGWAEVDGSCQTVFTAQDLLANWAGWRGLLESLAGDENINKQRAALVLLTAPISQSADERILNLSLALIDRLKAEKDKRITKAISWLLRKGIKQHRDAISDFLDSRSDSLPAIAARETRKKLATGKK
ncbi:MAG: DNA alkylation repair protein [Chloroflexi bacterium]|nr:DNA alkylation repair protein [Chloroflexota bacterium]